MYNVKQITNETWWLGYNDRRLELFENFYPIPRGVSYNAYLIADEKTVLLDGIDEAGIHQYLEDVKHILNGRPLDYMVIHHMEPDHGAVIKDLVQMYPDVRLVASAKALQMVDQFFDFDKKPAVQAIKEGEELCLGKHTLKFVGAPFVHWPEVMVSYDTLTGALFSADGFGTFGALNGNIFADECGWNDVWVDDCRRYYTNIVGKYGIQTTTLLKKAAGLDLKMICPLHGPVWRKDLNVIIDLYAKWASYTPEVRSAAIFYGSVYGGTANAADILAMKLAERGLTNLRVVDVSKTDLSESLAVAFQYSHLVFASATYNMEIFTPMQQLLHDMAEHNLQNRTVGIIQNGSWAPVSGKKINELVAAMKGMTILEPMVTIRSAVKEETLKEIDALADAIAASLK